MLVRSEELKSKVPLPQASADLHSTPSADFSAALEGQHETVLLPGIAVTWEEKT